MGSRSIVGLVAGLLGGFFAGLAGVGGGIVMIPLMTWLAGLSQHRAHGTSLVAIVFTGAVGAGTYHLHRAVDWRVSLMLAVGAILFARLGALYAHSLSERRLKRGFGIFLIFVSGMLLLHSHLLSRVFALGFWPRIATLFATGVFAGFVSGMMGVGGGVVMVPPMVILAGMSQHLAQGTSLLAMVAIGATGALTHYRLGNVDTKVAAGLVVGAMAGGYLGGTAANMLPEPSLKLIFACVGILMGIRCMRG